MVRKSQENHQEITQVMVMQHMQMDNNMMANMSMVFDKARVNTSMQMVIDMKVILKIIKNMELVN
jgi:hypothetical protein